MPRRFQFSLRWLLVLTALVALLCVLIPPVYEFLFPTPRVLSDTIVVEQGVKKWHHLEWSNGVQTRVPFNTARTVRNGSGLWRPPSPSPANLPE